MLDRKWFGISLGSWLLMLIILAAFFIRIRGIDWPRFHPDEHPISHWIEQGGPDRVYPGGTFVLIRPFRFCWEKSLSVGAALAAYTGHDSVPIAQPDYILMGRYFNALMGSLSCIFIYLTANCLARSRWAALFAALLMAFAQFPVEHAHYAQSDISMLFVMTVMMWLWTASVASGKMGWFIAAGLACGFAAGTKFTLMILLLPWLLSCLLRGIDLSRGRRLRGTIKYMILGLLFFVLGLVAASPAILDLDSFMAGMAHEKTRVYGETVSNLGIMAGDDRVRMLSHLRVLGQYMLTLGLGWIFLWAVGMITLLAQKRYRRFWLPFLGIPLIYTYYWIAVAPWVRTQEFLNYIPFAAVLAALPLATIGRRWRSFAVRGCVLLVAIIAFGGSFQRSMRVSSIYGWLDSRLLATRWLQRHEPPGATLAAEKYANVQPRGTRVGVDMAARAGLEALQSQGFDFLLSQGTVGTRGMFNPLTHELYPHYQKAYEHFLAGTDFLKSWALMPTVSTHTSFSSMPIELYGFRKGTGQYSLDSPMSRPAFISHERFETLYPRGNHLGTATAFLVDHHGVTFGISSATELDSPVYVILYTEERPADVNVTGLGRGKRVQLAPYDHAVVSLKRPFWAPRLGHVEKIHARAKQHNKHLTYIPCYLQVAFSQAGADAIVADLPSAPRPRRPRSAEQQQLLKTILDADVSAVDYMGTSAIAYDQFARFYFAESDANARPLAVNLRLPPDVPPDSGRVTSGRLVLPFWRTPAPLKVTFDVAVQSDDVADWDETLQLRFVDDRTDQELAVMPVSQEHDAWYRRVTLAFKSGQAGRLKIRIEAPLPLNLTFQNVEVSWSFCDVVETQIGGAGQHNRETIVSAGDGARESTGSIMSPFDITFEPFIKLIGFGGEDEEDNANFLLEPTTDHLPPLNAVLYRLKRGKWRVVQRVPIDSKSASPGELLPIAFQLNSELRELPAGRLGIGVESAVPWFPGRLRISGRESDVFKLPVSFAVTGQPPS